MKVSDLMRMKMRIMSDDQPLYTASEWLFDNPDTPVVVVSSGGEPAGCLTPKQVLKALALRISPEQPLADCPLQSAGTTHADETIERIAADRFDYWLVLDNRKITGILKRTDVESIHGGISHDFYARMNLFMDCIYKPIIAIDTHCTITLCNQAACNLIKLPRNHIIGKAINAVLQTSPPSTLLKNDDFELVQKFTIDGKTYITNWAPIKIDHKMVGTFAIMRDITEIESMNSELQRIKLISKELNAIIDSSFDGIYLTDCEGRTLRINKAYERITGIKPHEVVGRTMKELVTEGFYDESVTLRVLEDRKPVTIIQKIKNRKTVVVTGNPILDDNGRIFRVVTNVRDVTELNRLQQKLEKMERLKAEYELELRKLRKKSNEDGRFVIKSKKMTEIYELALRLAHVDSTILIQGESGVGKEVFSEIVHNHGPRRDQPFMKISCAAIPENLLESELFGYAPGAFTGAIKEGRAGIFERAHRGTIFLDEIGEMPMSLQVKLLRVLQQREIVRIGDSTPIRIDTRIMAATNRNLEEMVNEREFRRDLFFRLNVVPVVIPPLRERKEAITPLFYFFLDKYNRKYGFSKQIEPEVIDVFSEYDWPGNVRELDNLIERMVVMAHSEVITANDLPNKLKSLDLIHDTVDFEVTSLKNAVETFESRMIRNALQKYGTTRETARMLGVNQSTIVRKAGRYGIQMGKQRQGVRQTTC
jgi:PAS domain S-box-containing protein